MATISITPSGTFKASVRRVGLPASIKTFKTKLDAEKWARFVESEMDRGIFVNRSEADTVTVGELIDRYIIEVTPLKRSAIVDRQRLLFLKKHFGYFIVSQLQSKHIARYRDKRLAEGKAGATVVKELGSLTHLLDVSIKDWGIPLVTNVACLVRKPKQARGRDRRLMDGEETILLQAAKESKSFLLAPLIILALETGMRLGELLSLEWGNIDLNKRVATLLMTKNGESRNVPLSKKAVETLNNMPRHLKDPRLFYKWVRSDSFENTWRRVCKKKGLQDLRFHDLRHEAASRLFEKGLTVMEVSSITGHKTLQMLKRYTHLRAEDLIVKLG